MPVTISLDLSAAKLLQSSLTAEQRAELDQGALPPDSVWFRLVTKNDERVRPSHAALHNTVWRAGDPAAPVPPMEYGCRCMIEYCAAPDTAAEAVLPPADAEPTTPAEAFATYLDTELPEWQTIAKAIAKRAPIDQLSAATAALRAAHPDWTQQRLRDYAQLIVTAAPVA